MWVYIRGVIEVEPLGRTQAEKTYILQTVLDHLPEIKNNSERRFDVYINQKRGYSTWTDEEELGYPFRENKMQDNYFLTIDGRFRHTNFDCINHQFARWLNRLSKRLMVRDIDIKITDTVRFHRYDNHKMLIDNFESLSSVNGNVIGKPNWCEWYMWKAPNNYIESKRK